MQVDYFDESLFDIGFLPTQDSIPITLGSISSTSTPQDSAVNGSSSEMPICTTKLPYHKSQSSRSRKESNYMNTEPADTNCYDENVEGHYARLSELNTNTNCTPIVNSSKGDLNFYIQKAAEQRARTRSRGRESGTRARSRSTHRKECRSRSRGRSASRDIMALYTNRPVSGCQLRNNSISPQRDSINHLRRRQSLSPDTQNKNNNRSSTSKLSSAADKCSSAENTLTQRVVAQDYTCAGSRHTATQQESSKLDDGTSFMTLLEMDDEKNAQIEKELLAANSIKPANIKMMMIASHVPSTSWAAKDEVTVKVGDIVTGIYKQNEWLYVVTVSKDVGFVPYSFTKPVKVPLNSRNNSKPKTAPKPVNGILKTSNGNKHKQRKSHPKFSVKVRTAADNDSLSSESGSAITEDFVYTRKKSSVVQSHADCIVIDTDDLHSALDRSQNVEETSTYCSDSGISDPSSNHSEDMDSLHSPLSLNDERLTSALILPNSTPRLPNERIVSVTTELLAHSPYNSMKSNKDSQARNKYHSSTAISDMPLGPLGARLAKLNMDKTDSFKRESRLNNDTRERAKCTSTTPSSLRPEIPKDYNGPRVTVVFDYEGGNQDDLVVYASDIVTVLNGEDIEWIWVQRRDGKEGFIPREYVIPLELSAQNRRQVGISLL